MIELALLRKQRLILLFPLLCIHLDDSYVIVVLTIACFSKLKAVLDIYFFLHLYCIRSLLS